MDSWGAGDMTDGRGQYQYQNFVAESQLSQPIAAQGVGYIAGQPIERNAPIQDPDAYHWYWQTGARYPEQQYEMHGHMPTKMRRMDNEFSGYANGAQSMTSFGTEGYSNYAPPSYGLPHMNGAPRATAPRRKQPQAAAQNNLQLNMMPAPAQYYGSDPAVSRPHHFEYSGSVEPTWVQGVPQSIGVSGPFTTVRTQEAHWDHAGVGANKAPDATYSQNVYADSSSSCSYSYGNSNHASYSSLPVVTNVQCQTNYSLNVQGTWPGPGAAFGNQLSSFESSHDPYYGHRRTVFAEEPSHPRSDSVETAPSSVDSPSEGSQSNNGDPYTMQEPSPPSSGNGDVLINKGDSNQNFTSSGSHQQHYFTTAGCSTLSQNATSTLAPTQNVPCNGSGIFVTVVPAPPENSRGSHMVNFAHQAKVQAHQQHSKDFGTRKPGVGAVPRSAPANIAPVPHRVATSSAARQSVQAYIVPQQGTRFTNHSKPQISTLTAAVGSVAQLQSAARPGDGYQFVPQSQPRGHPPSYGRTVTQSHTQSLAPAPAGQNFTLAPQRVQVPSNHGQIRNDVSVAHGRGTQTQGTGALLGGSRTAPQNASIPTQAPSVCGSLIHTGHHRSANSQAQARQTFKLPGIAPGPTPVSFRPKGQTQPPTAPSRKHQASLVVQVRNTASTTVKNSAVVRSGKKKIVPRKAEEVLQESLRLFGPSFSKRPTSTSTAEHLETSYPEAQPRTSTSIANEAVRSPPIVDAPAEKSTPGKESRAERENEKKGSPEDTKSCLGKTSDGKEPPAPAEVEKSSPEAGLPEAAKLIATAVELQAEATAVPALEPEIAAVPAVEPEIAAVPAIIPRFMTASAIEPGITNTDQSSGPSLPSATCPQQLPSVPQACDPILLSDSESRAPTSPTLQIFDLGSEVSSAEVELIDLFLLNETIDFPNSKDQVRTQPSPVPENDSCVDRNKSSEQSFSPSQTLPKGDQLSSIAERPAETPDVMGRSPSAKQASEAGTSSRSPIENWSLFDEDTWEAINEETEELLFKSHPKASAKSLSAYSGIFTSYGADEAPEEALNKSVESKTDRKSPEPRAAMKILE